MHDLNYRLPQKRQLKTSIPGPASVSLAQRRDGSVARAATPGLPAYIVEGDGGILVDADGNSIIDFASGIAVTSVGASNAAVVEAVRESVGHLTHTCFLSAPYESYVAVTEKLADITPGDHDKRSLLLSTGAEAVENAVKIARNYTGRSGVVVFDRAFHGRTNLTLAMTAKSVPYKTGFGPFSEDVYRAPMSYPLRDGLDGVTAAERTISHIEREVGAENLACIVIEPIQGEGGFVVPAQGFIPTLFNWCKDNSVVFIADEIQAGMCRTGQWFAIEREGVVPDLMTMAKGIAGGRPLSAVTGRAEIMDAPIAGALGGTYGGNPVACAAALAAISQMEELDLAGRARQIEGIIREELALLTQYQQVAELRGSGAMMAVELVNSDGLPDAMTTKKVAAVCQRAGVLVLVCGLDGNVIRLLPPLVISEDILRDGLRVLAQALQDEFDTQPAAAYAGEPAGKR